MITLNIGETEYFDQENEKFIQVEGKKFRFEHSLKAIFEWESIWKTPFLRDGDKTHEQTLSYIECMCLDEGFDIKDLTVENAEKLMEYIKDKHTATTINQQDENSSKIITAEVLYAYLAIAKIPFAVEEWNLDRLLMTIGSVSAINTPPKKMSRAEVMAQNRKLNEQRRKELNSKG